MRFWDGTPNVTHHWLRLSSRTSGTQNWDYLIRDMSRVSYKFGGGRWSGRLIIHSEKVLRKKRPLFGLSNDQHPGVFAWFQATSAHNTHNTFDPHPKINYPTLSLFFSDELALTRHFISFRP